MVKWFTVNIRCHFYDYIFVLNRSLRWTIPVNFLQLDVSLKKTVELLTVNFREIAKPVTARLQNQIIACFVNWLGEIMLSCFIYHWIFCSTEVNVQCQMLHGCEYGDVCVSAVAYFKLVSYLFGATEKMNEKSQLELPASGSTLEPRTLRIQNRK